MGPFICVGGQTGVSPEVALGPQASGSIRGHVPDVLCTLLEPQLLICKLSESYRPQGAAKHDFHKPVILKQVSLPKMEEQITRHPSIRARRGPDLGT